jgi:hypothetical protein
MHLRMSNKIKIISILIIVAALVYFLLPSKQKIDYNTQVKPILNKKCISCHGGVKQQSNFSLLFREEALQKCKSGKYGIIPFDAANSELVKRIKETNEEERMPYKHEPLSKDEIAILEKWINQGAEWGTHWAYKAVEKTEIPNIKSDWIKNDIDKFVVKKLNEEKLQPSSPADKATLLRRVSLDLIGIPINETAAKKFLNDSSTNAYTNLVDTLLASTYFGEKWASMWMDLARYGDTKGFEADNPRTIWRYRDWLIKAYNKDKPYNDFLLEQLAGDLLPNASIDNFIATAFHRNTNTNDEGGTDNEEFRIAAVMDRVNTTWSAIMGTTFNCVQCHSHPYDPFKHDEYYKFMAFFNNTRDEDTEHDYPLLRFYKGEDSAKQIQLQNWLQNNATKDVADWYNSFVKNIQPSINSHKCDNYNNGILFQNNYASLDPNGTCRLPNINTTNKQQFIFKYLTNKVGVLKIFTDSTKTNLVTTINLKDAKQKWLVEIVDLPALEGKKDFWFQYNTTNSKDKLPLLFDWFAFAKPFPGKGKPDYENAKKMFIDLLMAKPETMPVMIENNEDQFRETTIFERGSWLTKGEVVQPDVPHILNALPSNAPKNRLGLALWLTNKENPLTSRTMVNRVWEQLFGTGLAETMEDLGTQSTIPIYKDLLDHLSYEFMHTDKWSIKKLLKKIVTSATYMQSSKTNEALIAKDPNNYLFARFSRIRLTGEQLRDQGLAVSNLLSNKMYGPGIMPYQPEGVWSSPYNQYKWTLSKGEDQYRRAVYTYWKKTAPYPSMINFDGGTREVCTVRRIRTNTPLQALNTLNDSAYLDMARSFALQLNKQNNVSTTDKIANGYYAMFYKTISTEKLNALNDLYNKAFTEYKNNSIATNELMGNKKITALPQHAAMTVVTNAMMNLDEWLNKN